MPEEEQTSVRPPTPGERLRRARERTGRSRVVVAGQLGRSEDWLKRAEKSEKGLPVPELVALARVLGVRNLAELIGDAEMVVIPARRSAHPVVPDIREAIEAVELAPLAPTVTAVELGERVARAWRLWHVSAQPRADAGALLPQLIRDGRRALRFFEGLERRQAAAALSEAYALAEQVLAWVADAPLVWLSADRCMSAAEQADRPGVLAGAAWVVGNVWRSTGREEDAWQLAQQACGSLESSLADSEEGRALWGACQLHSAVTAARLGRVGDALRCVDEADRMARRTAPGYAHPWTVFGQANTDLTAVSVMVDLKRSKSALESASLVDPARVPSVMRQSRLWLDTALAYQGQGDWNGVYHNLERAVAVSVEAMTYHPLSRGLADELVHAGGPQVQQQARVLARRIGLAA
jgi:tetratricopeptide (TPR) repeat protein